MPELAEVEYYRRIWDQAVGCKVLQAGLRAESRVFRDGNPETICKALPGRPLLSSAASGKQLLFQFGGNGWLRIHLGMTGKLLLLNDPEYAPAKHDHFYLKMEGCSLVFQDPRMFGRVEWRKSDEVPDWWRNLPPALLSGQFRLKDCEAFFARKKQSAMKGVLLQQERFPGIGNWMADEILWRARILPMREAGTLQPDERKRIFVEIKNVCRDAMRVIAPDWSEPPEHWLFPHRWKAGGKCPCCSETLARETIAGRTTCFCRHCQK